MSRKPRYKPGEPAPRLPLPQKPPKSEPKPNAYTRKEKHVKDWEAGESESGGLSKER